MLARGDSVGVFQLESEGMQEALQQGRPDASSTTSSRWSRSTGPGPMRFIPDYARGKRDPSSVRYIDERLRAITEPTYGIALYQEQLMQIARDIAGFPGPKADTLRRAIGKKKRDLMATPEAGLRRRLQRERHVSRASANQLWALMESAADYSLQQVARRLLRA